MLQWNKWVLTISVLFVLNFTTKYVYTVEANAAQNPDKDEQCWNDISNL